MLRAITLLLIGFTVLTAISIAQKRYVVSSMGDVIPIQKGSSAAEAIRQQLKRVGSASTGTSCVPVQEYGYIPSMYQWGSQSEVYSGHKDIFATWFESPAHGTLDSVFLMPGNAIGDTIHGYTSVSLRIHKSNVYTGHGPGWGPWPLPNQCWGYYTNTYDHDAGVGAFLDDASDTAWHTTYHDVNAICDPFPCLPPDTTIKSFPPAGEEIWGMGGVYIPLQRRTVSGISLASLPPKPELEKGEPFLISLRVPTAATQTGHPLDVGTNPPFTDPTAVSLMSQYGWQEYLTNEVSRTYTNWKFYEHPTYCGSGWVARGTANYFIWYSMTVLSNLAPNILQIDPQEIGDSVTIRVDVEDCNFSHPDSAGIGHADLIYTDELFGFETAKSLPMRHIGGSTWSGTFPKVSSSSKIRYYVHAVDLSGDATDSPVHSYNVASIRSHLYAADTAAARTFNGSIRLTGIAIDKSSFFIPPSADSSALVPDPKDNGTAGPFVISNGFEYAGDTMWYAWVGVDGGIALSKTATDTLDLNSGGQYAVYDFPETPQTKPYPGGRGSAGVPRNFIGVHWKNYTLVDGTSKLFHQDDADHFIVEWDSMGTLGGGGGTSTFRVVLNKQDGTIEFQYDALDEANPPDLVALDSDSGNTTQRHGAMVMFHDGTPGQMRPRSGSCVGYWPMTLVAVADGWNLLSTPGIAFTPRKSILFPEAISRAFSYVTGYIPSDSLFPGIGYWLKYNGAQTIYVPSSLTICLDIPLRPKWNLFGSLAHRVKASSITTSPSGLINTAALFTYNGTWDLHYFIEPGHAYWVKATDPGMLHMCSSGAAETFSAGHEGAWSNTISVSAGSLHQDLYLTPAASLKSNPADCELPPAALNGFDARFSSGNIVEGYADGGETHRIDINSDTYPVTIRWKLTDTPVGRTFVLTDAEGGKLLGKVIMQNEGSIQIQNSAVKSVLISSETGIDIPKQFALSRNYPNPFNPTTRMQLDVPVQSHVSIEVFDVLGRAIAVIANGDMEIGYHNVEWNGIDANGALAPSGTYFIRVNCDKFTTSQKILLMR